MIIKVDDEYIEDILTNDISDDELSQFNRLFHLMYEKKLFVRADKREFYQFLLDKHRDCFSKYEISVITKICSDYTSIMSNVLKIDYLFSVTKNTTIYSDKNNNYHCSIPIKDLPNELSPCLYTENDSDGAFYFQTYKTIGDGYPLYLLYRGYGGGSGKGVIENLIKEKAIFFVVTDSDREYPGCGVGGTAKGIKKLFKHNNLFWSQLILNVREKENLVPIQSFVLLDTDMTPLLSFLKSNTSEDIKHFFDIKDGIDPEKYSRKMLNVEWKNIHYPAINYVENTFHVVFDDEDKKGITGVGDNFISNMLNNNKIDIPSIKTYWSVMQKNDWKNVFSLITKFGYCYSLVTS